MVVSKRKDDGLCGGIEDILCVDPNEIKKIYKDTHYIYYFKLVLILGIPTLAIVRFIVRYFGDPTVWVNGLRIRMVT